MAQNVSLYGADYPSVPAVLLPKTGGGTAKFVELSDQNGKVVKNGELISQYGRVIFSNGFYDTTEYCQVNVAVPNKEAAILEGTISGSYTNSEVTKLKMYSLYNCPNLEEIHFPNCLTVEPYAAAMDAGSSGGLQVIDLPLVETIQNDAFRDLPNLEEVNAPSLETVESNVFRSDTALERLYAPNLTEVQTSAFHTCSSLSDATLGPLETVGNYGFAYCNSLPQSDVPFGSLETVGSYGFRECAQFVSIVAPKLSSIGTGAFYGCSNLERFDLGGGLTAVPSVGIGSNAFAGCTKNNHFVIRYTGGVYPLAGNTAFGSAKSTPLGPTGAGYFYFPRDLVASYKTATNWKGWSNKDTRFRALEDYTVDGTVTGALDPTKI